MVRAPLFALLVVCMAAAVVAQTATPQYGTGGTGVAGSTADFQAPEGGAAGTAVTGQGASAAAASASRWVQRAVYFAT